MENSDFNENWICYQADNRDSAKSVSLPHDAMISEPRTIASKGGNNIGWFEGKDYVYEKDFFLSEELFESKIIFEFEGVYHNAEVFINGKKAAYRPYGYTNFHIFANEFLKFGETNNIKVLAFNSDQPNSRWYSGTGIYRPVHMYVFPKEHIEFYGLKIDTVDYELPKIQVSIKTSCSENVKIEIFDGDKILASESAFSDGEAKFFIELPSANLWSCDNPYLYTCKATFMEDERTSSFGIRKIECDSKNGFCINGVKTLLLGACVHHDNGLLGAIAHSYAEMRKVKILKMNGFNAVRMAHNPCSRAFLEACDRLGMLVMDEYADMWYIHKNKYDYADYLEKYWKQDLTDMVNKDFNHPSVIMYSIGNEVAETAQKRGIELCEQMTQFIKALDNRPVTCGVNIFFNLLSSLGFGIYTDKKAEQAANKKKGKAVGSEFFNKLAGIFGDKAMKLGASLHGSDMKTKDAFSKLDVAGYNYGILRYKKDAKKYPNRVMVGSETFCSDAYNFYEMAKKIPSLIGDFVWAGFDYIGEAGIGSWVYEEHGRDFSDQTGWLTAGSGRIDVTGKPNGEAAFMRVAYDKQKIALAAVPADNACKKHSPSAWKMTNAIESWSFNGFEGSKTKIELYSKAYKVILTLNGKKIGQKKRGKGCRFVFKSSFRKGELTAIGFNECGEEIAKTSLISAGEETKLSLRAEENTIKIDDLCYVRLQFTDNNGILKPLINGKIKIDVNNGTLLALGHACPYNKDGYNKTETETYYGEALAILKPHSLGKLIVTGESVYGKDRAEIIVG